MKVQLILRMATAAALLGALPCCDTGYFGAGAAIHAIPPRPANATYPDWEYLCVAPHTLEELNRSLEDAGNRGWELVTVIPNAFCFKRPKTPGNAPPPGSAADAAPSRTTPQQPSKDSVHAAIRSVMPAAKACVAGASEPSRADLGFASDGTVNQITVVGWAATNNRADCVKTALHGANVGPFSQPSFTVHVSILP